MYRNMEVVGAAGRYKNKLIDIKKATFKINISLASSSGLPWNWTYSDSFIAIYYVQGYPGTYVYIYIAIAIT